MEKIRVLFLAASPKVSPLALDQEIREITTKIRAAEHRDSLEVISRWAVRPDDMQQALLEHRPHILHFSGHGTESEELVLLDGKGEPKPVSKEALVHLLGVLKDNLRLIVLNACFSRPQAEAITQVIDCAVGMNRAVGDEAAIGFASAFYRAIGFGRSIQTAFDLGRSALMLDDIPEESTPELVARAGVDPAGIVLVQPDRRQHGLGLPADARGGTEPVASTIRDDHDVYISYATVDDRPAIRGWVSAFARNLEESLAAAFGVRDPDRIWWKRSNIDEEASLTEQIRAKVQKSACMVVILSQGYAQSQWCRHEREAFLAALAGQPDADRRLLLIDIGNLDEQNRPPEFSDKRPRHFFVQPPNTTDITAREPLGFPTPDPENKDHKQFFAQIDQLSRDLYERVSTVRGATAAASPSKPNAGVTLFVAESADDVAEEREELVRFLSDHFHVVPAIDAPLPNRWDEWQASVDAGLKASTLFVQVLGALPGRKIAGSDQKLVTAQFESARVAGKRIVSWRNTEPEAAQDGRLRELLAAAEFCGPITDFKREVKCIATPPPPRKIIERPAFLGDEAQPMVFIHAGAEDQGQAEDLSELLTTLNCFAATPLVAGPPEKIREDLAANLAECDGLILFYGQITPDWVRSQFRTLPRTLSQRQKLDPPRPLRALAICNGQPPDKPHPGVKAPGMHWIDLSVDSHREQLTAWVATLRTRGAS